MTHEETKQAIVGFTEFFKGITGNQDMKIPNDLAKQYGIEQQPIGDLISRQDAIKAIDEKAKRIKNEDTLNGLAGAVGILFDLPPVNPQDQKYCDRNICTKNEYNGIGCDECEVTKSQEPTDENLHREREQAYMQGYEDACKKYRQEPKTGHWIMNRQLERRTCDNCNKEYRWSFNPHNYCPNCGAKMVEEQKRSE